MDLVTFIKLAKSYSDLGSAVQGQLDDVLNDDAADCNPNALKEIKRFLRTAKNCGISADDCDQAISEIDSVIEDA